MDGGFCVAEQGPRQLVLTEMAKKLSGEAALLSWAQGAASSHGLTVKNLAAAWADGLAFAALAHRYACEVTSVV